MSIQEQLEEIRKYTLLSAKNALTIDEASLLTGLSVNTLYKMTSDKRIPHYKPSNKLLYFKKSELENWMLTNRMITTEEVKH
jgi:excisionase family DNA binding protein